MRLAKPSPTISVAPMLSLREGQGTMAQRCSPGGWGLLGTQSYHAEQWPTPDKYLKVWATAGHSRSEAFCFFVGPNLDPTYVTNQTPCPNDLTQHSGPKSLLAVCICPFCPQPNGWNLTTSVQIWSLTLVPIFLGPEKPGVREQTSRHE